MILWGPFAWLVWIVFYGIPVLLAWLYLKHVAWRTGFWYALHALVFLLLGTACLFIALNIGTHFVVAPFIGFGLAGFLVSASIPVLSRKYREWWCGGEDSEDVRSFPPLPPYHGGFDAKKRQTVHYRVTVRGLRSNDFGQNRHTLALKLGEPRIRG